MSIMKAPMEERMTEIRVIITYSCNNLLSRCSGVNDGDDDENYSKDYIISYSNNLLSI